MKIVSQFLLVCALLIVACKPETTLAPDRSPAWLTSLISQIEAEPIANPPALIARYDFNGATVYYLPPRCCDKWSTLYREDGSIVCHPDGGLTGKGDGGCPAFLAERKNEVIVWRDSRGST